MPVLIALAMLGMQTMVGRPLPSEMPTDVGLPKSFQRSVLRSCAPETLEAADECLRKSLNAEDLAIFVDRIPARRFRGFMDCEVELAWKLGDPTSPMAKVMDGLLGMHDPRASAGMIISDFQVRATQGSGLDFNEVRKAMAAQPSLTTGRPTSCDAKTTPTAREN